MKPSMKAALIHSFGNIRKIEIEEIPTPFPAPHEVQVAIKYAGVNPVDWKIVEGMLKTRMDYQFPITLGWDMSGIVSAVGSEVQNFREGDPVFAYCRKKIIHDGTYAEYICLDAAHVVKKPESLTFAQAAVIPLSSLTAWQALFECAKLKKNERILIHAGAGGVGGFAIQFAKLIGSYCLTTTSHSNFDYVQKLGADTLIDYTKEDFVTHILQKFPSGVDVVFDTVGGESLQKSYRVTSERGRLVTIAGIIDPLEAAARHLKAEFLFVHPDGKNLSEIATLYESRKLLVPKIQEIPFDEVESALRKSREGHTQGKLVLKIS